MPDTILGSLQTTARLTSNGVSTQSTVDVSGDQDWWQIDLVAGASYRFNMNAAIGSPLDSYLRLLDSSGAVLSYNDDSLNSLNSQLDYTATRSGTYYLSAQGYSNSTGGYALSAALVTPVAVTPTVSVSATNASQFEGEIGTRAFTFTVTRSSGVGSGTVNWAVRHGTTDAADFSGATSGVVSFAAGETSRTLTVQVAGDRMLEGNEGFTVELSAPTGLVLGTASAAGTILNDDTDTVGGTLASTAAVAVGGSVGSVIDYSGDQDWWRVNLVAGTTYQFNMNAAIGSSLDSYLRLLNASGMELAANDDANGTRNSQIAYTANSSGTYYLSAQAFSNYSTGAYMLTAVELTPTVSISATNASQTEGDAGTKAFTFTVTRSSAGVGSGTVNWAVRHGTTDAADFSGAMSGVVSFAAGETSRTLTVQVAGDRMLEGNEGFTVELSAPTGLVLGTATAAGTVLNDDTDTVGGTLASTAAVAVGGSVGSAIDYSGDQDWWRVNLVAGTTYRFNMNAASGSALDSYLRVLNASGIELAANDDANGTLNSQIDYTASSSGTYYLSAQGLSSLSTGAYTLTAAEVTPTVSITAMNANQAEGDAGTKAFTFTVSRSSAVGSGTVNWSVLFGATNEADFSGATSGVVSFAAGETSRTLAVRVVGDMVQESTEVFSVALSAPTGMVLGSASAMGVIGNDDVDVGASTASTAAVAVGGSVSSAIDYGGDQDWWRVNLVAGTTYRFNMNAGLDSYLRLLNDGGVVLAANDDANGTLHSQIDYTAIGSGTYYLSAQGLSGFSTGVYTLSATVAPTVDIMAAAASQHEGDAGSREFTFTVTRSGTGVGSGTVNWSVRHGTTDAADFSGATSGVVSFAAGETSRTLAVHVAGDRLLEANESFTVELSAPTGLVLGTASAAGMVLNDDTDSVGDTLSGAAVLAVGGGSVTSAVDYIGDQDWWRVNLVAGTTYRFNMNAASGSGLDCTLWMLGSSGQVLATSNDPLSAGADITWTASSSGTYYLSAQGLSSFSTGAYTLSAIVAPTVDITAAAASQHEGDGGSREFTFTVTRSGTGVGGGAVSWAVRHGTTDAADFSGATSGVVSFAAGETSRTLTVQVAGDRLQEANEGFTVELSAPTGLVLGTTSAAGTVLNDDTDSVGDTPSGAAVLAVGGGSVSSAIDYGGDQDWWRVNLVAGTTYRFNMNAASGSGLDSYLRLLNASGTLLTANDDSNWTNNSQIDYTVATSGTYYLSAQGYSSSTGNYQLSAVELTPTVSISATNASQTEGDAGTKAFTFTVTRSSAGVGGGTVNWAVRHGTTDAADFSGATSGVVSFAAGETSRTLTVQVAGDQVVEGNEGFTVELSASTGLVLGTASAAGTILNDDTDTVGGTLASTAAVAVGGSVGSVIDYSGDQDWWRVNLVAGTAYQFNMNAAIGSSLDSYLRLLDASGMALAANDDANGTRNSQIAYTASSSGTYYLSAQGYSIFTGAYTLTAAEVTPTVSISATNASQTEGDAGTKAFTFTVTRSSAGVGGGTVNWAVRHGTTDAADFSGATSGVVSFAAGETSRTLTVQVAGDQMLEGNEGFTVELSAPTGLVLGTASSAGTILNDDTDTVGGTLASTAAVAVGGSVGSVIDYGGDQDWWRVNLVAGTAYQFNMNAAIGSSLDSYLRLLNASGMELAANDDANGTRNSQIAYTAGSSGTYYLSAQGLSSATGAYTLSAIATPTVSITAMNANQAEGNAGTKAFTFTVTRSSAAGSGTVNWGVLYGATDAADFSGATSGVVSFAAGETSRTLAVQVAGDLVQESTEVFSVALSAPTGMVLGAASAMGVIGNDDVDVGASTASTAVVAVGGSVGSVIDYIGDQDWWRVNLVAGTTYRFNMSAASGSSLDSYLRLLNASGSVLLTNDNTGTSRDAQISYTATTTGAYYLSAQGTLTSTGQYIVRAVRTLTGTAAADVFRFATVSEGPTDITDFTSGSDRIQVVSSNFGSLPVGTLASSRLVRGANPVATGTGAAFLYDTSTGQLTWDSNGALAGGTSVIANLGAGRSLVAGDIQVVAA